MFPYILYPQQERKSAFEKEYDKFLKKMLKKQFGDDEAKKKKLKPWDKITRAELAFIILAFTPAWLPLYIAGIRLSIIITRQLLQGI